MTSSKNSFIISTPLTFTGTEFIENAQLTVENGLITSITSGDCPSPSSHLPIFSFPKTTLLPGLIDSHTHGLYANPNVVLQPLRFGVTTVCDMHNDPPFIASLQKLSASDPALYSDFKCAGVAATVRGGWPEPVVLSHGVNARARATVEAWPKLEREDEASAYVDQQISQCGAEYIKLMGEVGNCLCVCHGEKKEGDAEELPVPSTALQKALIQAAHERGVKAVGHALSWKGAKELLKAGVDGLMHCPLDAFPEGVEGEELLQLLKESSAFCNPTLTMAGSQTTSNDEFQRMFAEDDPLAKKMLVEKAPRKALALAYTGEQRQGKTIASFDFALDNARKMYHVGVPLLVGSDSSGQARGQHYGMAVHQEMWLMKHRISMTAQEVLEAATSSVANRLGFTDRGRLEVGMRADLCLVEGDVRKHFEDEQNLCLPVKHVWREGWVNKVPSEDQ